jgi:hypothetical protein
VHRVWNGMEGDELPAFSSNVLTEWARCAQGAKQQLLKQPDLVSQLRSMAL